MSESERKGLRRYAWWRWGDGRDTPPRGQDLLLAVPVVSTATYDDVIPPPPPVTGATVEPMSLDDEALGTPIAGWDTPRLRAALKVVLDVARLDPVYADEELKDRCALCHAWASRPTHELQHGRSCVWVRARDLARGHTLGGPT